MTLNDTFRVRTSKQIKRRFNKIAKIQGRRPSDLGRDLIAAFVEEKERELATAEQKAAA